MAERNPRVRTSQPEMQNAPCVQQPRMYQVTYRFPDDFWWGSATSATQIEGATDVDGRAKSIWDHWYELEPHRFYQGVGPDQAPQFYYRYKEDIALMRELGHNSFRFSISWSRLCPGGDNRINEKAVAFYNDVIDTLLDHGIEPFVCLFHFDTPLRYQELGGWENRDIVEAYAQYAVTCFRLFGDRVKKWFTHNEPMVVVEGGYLYDFHYPNVVDFRRAWQVWFHLLLAHAKAVQAYRESGQDGQIGIILNLTPSYPRSQNPADIKASQIADAFFNRSFLDPVIRGELPEDLLTILRDHDSTPAMREGDLEVIRRHPIDLLGVNYYQPRRVKAKEHLPHPDAPLLPTHFFDYYEMPGRKMNVYRGWEIYEKGVYDILINLRDHYGNIPCFISENGMGVQDEHRFMQDGMIHDDYRIEFFREHLKWVHKALQEGCNVKGYHVWTFMDNWSWINGYKNRYGLVAVDLEHNYRRTVKKSGYWFKQVAAHQGF